MSTPFAATYIDDSMDIKWRPMFILSMVLHVIAALIILFVPNTMPSRYFQKDVVYEVDLVELSDLQKSSPKVRNTTPTRKNRAIITRNTHAKRIPVQEQEKKPLIISKRTVSKEVTPIQKPEIPPIKKLETTPPKIMNPPEIKEDNEPETEDVSHLRDALSRIKEKVAVSSKPIREGRPSEPSGGFSMRIYQMEVETKVRGNWAYPTALKSQKNLEAVVVLRVKRDGRILKYELIKRSNNIVFDESVIKAIERTGSMPPFPEGFIQDEEEIEITFNIKDL